MGNKLHFTRQNLSRRCEICTLAHLSKAYPEDKREDNEHNTKSGQKQEQ